MLEITRHGSVAQVVLNRPEVGNAFNDELVGRLTNAFETLDKEEAVRVIILTGAGRLFSAGADLKWMTQMKDASPEENLRDARMAARLFHRVYRSSKAVIARINGAARAGGVGLIAACDIAVAAEEASFAFSEARIGLVPAVISPFVIRKMTPGVAQRLFLTGEQFNAQDALRWGLIDQVTSASELDSAVDHFAQMLLRSGPGAVTAAKSLVAEVTEKTIAENESPTAEIIARLRRSPEALEGMAAFLERRDPAWCR